MSSSSPPLSSLSFSIKIICADRRSAVRVFIRVLLLENFCRNSLQWNHRSFYNILLLTPLALFLIINIYRIGSRNFEALSKTQLFSAKIWACLHTPMLNNKYQSSMRHSCLDSEAISNSCRFSHESMVLNLSHSTTKSVITMTRT